VSHCKSEYSKWCKSDSSLHMLRAMNKIHLNVVSSFACETGTKRVRCLRCGCSPVIRRRVVSRQLVCIGCRLSDGDRRLVNKLGCNCCDCISGTRRRRYGYGDRKVIVYFFSIMRRLHDATIRLLPLQFRFAPLLPGFVYASVAAAGERSGLMNALLTNRCLNNQYQSYPV